MENATPIYSPMDPHIVLDNENYIAFSITVLSRYNTLLLQMHMTAAKRVLRYLGTTKSLKLFYPATSEGHGLHGFTDSDWAGRTPTRKSIGGCMFMDGGPISW